MKIYSFSLYKILKRVKRVFFAFAAASHPARFVPRQIGPRLPAPGRRVAAPAQSGAARFPDGRFAAQRLLACGFKPSAKGPGVLPQEGHLFGPKGRLICYGASLGGGCRASLVRCGPIL